MYNQNGVFYGYDDDDITSGGAAAMLMLQQLWGCPRPVNQHCCYHNVYSVVT